VENHSLFLDVTASTQVSGVITRGVSRGPKRGRRKGEGGEKRVKGERSNSLSFSPLLSPLNPIFPSLPLFVSWAMSPHYSKHGSLKRKRPFKVDTRTFK